jgi:bile acid:Na+ symporter, BASS family
MTEVLTILTQITMGIFMGFVLSPALAYGLTLIVPLTPPYAMGLILLGLAPCAPLLPMMADRARADLNYAAAFMLLASVGTVAYMPIIVPLMVKGLTVSAWAIAKPMLFLVLIPLVVGLAIQSRSASAASRIQPFVNRFTSLDTLVMLMLIVIIYGKGFIGSIGTYAIGSQVVFFSAITAASYALGFGMPRRQKSVVSLGISTRNCGAAMAPLFVAQGVDQNAIVMVSLGIPMMMVSSLIAARLFAARSSRPVSREKEGLKHGVVMKANELLRRIESKSEPLVIDPRSEFEFKRGHIPGAVNVPVRNILLNRAHLPHDRSREMVIACMHGQRAVMAKWFLALYGYRNTSLLEGYLEGWQEAGLPWKSSS